MKPEPIEDVGRSAAPAGCPAAGGSGVSPLLPGEAFLTIESVAEYLLEGGEPEAAEKLRAAATTLSAAFKAALRSYAAGNQQVFARPPLSGGQRSHVEDGTEQGDVEKGPIIAKKPVAKNCCEDCGTTLRSREAWICYGGKKSPAVCCETCAQKRWAEEEV